MQHVTHLLPHLGMPTAWMKKIATWQKNTKKKKKKLKELSVLKNDKHKISLRKIKKAKILTTVLYHTFMTVILEAVANFKRCWLKQPQKSKSP